MSSCRACDCEGVIREGGGPEIHSTLVSPWRVETLGDPVPEQSSHPGFNQLEMRVKQLEEVGHGITTDQAFESWTDGPLQDCRMLKEGFITLGVYQGESGQLRAQVSALQEELRVQNGILEKKVTSITSALQAVRISGQHSLQLLTCFCRCPTGSWRGLGARCASKSAIPIGTSFSHSFVPTGD